MSASLQATAFRDRKVKNSAADEVIARLEEAALISPGWSLSRILRSVRDYIHRLEIGAEIKINPSTGLPEGV